MKSEYAQMLKQYDQCQLQVLPQEGQVSLGISVERYDGVNNSQAIAHQLNNLLSAIRLQANLEKMSPIDRNAP